MEKQTQLSRLIACAKGQLTDRKPCICPGGMMNMMSYEVMKNCDCLWPMSHSNANQMAKLSISLNQNGGFENYGVPFCMTVEAENMGATVNMGNEMCEPHIVKSVLNSCSEMANLKEIDLNIGRVKVVLDAIRLLKSYNNQVPVIANLTGPISLGGTLLDMSVLLKQMRKTPIEAEQYLDFISDNLIKFANAQINAGADVICIAEPSGTGEILGPKLFMQYTVKYLNKIMDAVNAPVKIIHICGNLSSVYNCLSNLNCDVFSFDAVVPIKEVKKHLGNKVAMGNVSTFALGTMDEDKIKGLTKAALNFGADIISPACGLPIQTPLKNIQAMVDAVKQN